MFMSFAIFSALAASAIATPAGANTAAADYTCTVNADNVNYRTGPGTQYPSLGQVNQGQNIDITGNSNGWCQGNLWGGPAAVWIYCQYLNC
ncbi:hypothetical protein MHUMG1_09609 [Metarhizium humberi]|uniref:SH3b domain-containing protein n=1 Tax=Metarhizium humberi TaxID=2596975 RepID=A0A9P8S328_9HYPO|nr:hypothetical protein MHUMG1_09609 [Metarhizium humberi]